MKLNGLEIYPKTSFHSLMSFPPSFLGIMRFPDTRKKTYIPCYRTLPVLPSSNNLIKITKQILLVELYLGEFFYFLCWHE